MTRIDLGHKHYLEYIGWNQDRKLNPQYDGIPDVEKFAAIIYHPRGPKPVPGEDSEECQGSITFASDIQRQIHPKVNAWTVDSWDPLTVSPSILCSCGDHGFIKQGLWVPA